MPAQRLPLPRALECFQQCRAEADHAVLEDVIGCTALEVCDGGFFIERSGNENEGDIGQGRARQFQRAPAAEARNVVIAQYGVRCQPLQSRDERRFGSDVLNHGPWTQPIELAPDQGGVVLVVLDHEHSNLFHATVLAMPWICVCRRAGTL